MRLDFSFRFIAALCVVPAMKVVSKTAVGRDIFCSFAFVYIFVAEKQVNMFVFSFSLLEKVSENVIDEPRSTFKFIPQNRSSCKERRRK